VRNRLANIRLALVLLISTTIAATVSSLVATYLPAQVLSGLFAVILIYTSITMFRSGKKGDAAPATPQVREEGHGELDLDGTYHDAATGQTTPYRPRNVRSGMGISALAGVVAGLLGVGGGIIQMPVMNLLMGVPFKVATGTSNFMIGVTATSAAFVRYAQGDVNPLIAVPTALFVFFGARVGAWLVPRTPNALLRQIFAWVAIEKARIGHGRRYPDVQVGRANPDGGDVRQLRGDGRRAGLVAARGGARRGQ
jgi:uncharacterized membrane protein YfcA